MFLYGTVSIKSRLNFKLKTGEHQNLPDEHASKQHSQRIYENSTQTLWHKFLKLNPITSIKGNHKAQ